MNFKDISLKEKRIVSGHRLCPGCITAPIIRIILSATDKDVVVACATGCLEVATTIYPHSSWNAPFIHSAFENTAATISGIERAYKALAKKGKIRKEIKFLAIGGDGGSYDIGLQALSGAAERGHDFVYVCYNNEGYMNTGNQRSGATPYGASTSTSPAGAVKKGKENFRKDLTEIMAAHGIPYVAQASPSHPFDLFEKARKAFETKGPAFINVISPCNQWGIKSDEAVELADMAVRSCFWPLYEVENGKYKINFRPSKKLLIRDFASAQARFRHLDENEIEKIQRHTDEKWERLLSRESANEVKK